MNFAARTDENVVRIQDLVGSDQRLIVRMIENQLNATHTIVHQNLTNKWGMRKIWKKRVLKNLSQAQKDNMMETCLAFGQSQECHITTSPRPKKVRMSTSKIKSILIWFYDNQGFVHKKFMPQDQTVTRIFTEKFLNDFKKRAICVRLNVKNTRRLHHDNVPCHTQQFQFMSFWQVKTSLWFPSRLIHQTFSIYQN